MNIETTEFTHPLDENITIQRTQMRVLRTDYVIAHKIMNTGSRENAVMITRAKFPHSIIGTSKTEIILARGGQGVHEYVVYGLTDKHLNKLVEDIGYELSDGLDNVVSVIEKVIKEYDPNERKTFFETIEPPSVEKPLLTEEDLL